MKSYKSVYFPYPSQHRMLLMFKFGEQKVLFSFNMHFQNYRKLSWN